MTIPWSRFAEIVRLHDRFLLTVHIRPDGDALGSELAMAAILESLGKDVVMCNGFPVPPNLRFLDPSHKLKQLGVDIDAKELDDRQVLIILDTTAWAQLGTMAEVVKTTKALKVVIDHHVSADDLGAELFKNTDAEATGRLVVEAADHLGVALTPAIAAPAFVALATDTGWFRFASATADTLRLAARLVEAGAVPHNVYRELYETDTLARLRLIGQAFAHANTDLDGRLIYTWLTQADFAASGAASSDSEDVINMTLTVGGTQMAIILVEQATGGFKVSFRSRCDVDCSAIAEHFNGGGHKQAAGAMLNEPLASAQAKVLQAVRAAMGGEKS